MVIHEEDLLRTQDRCRETEQQEHREQTDELEKHWEEGNANEGDAGQVWRENQAGEETNKTGGKKGKTHHENTEDTQTRTLE